MKSTTFLFPGLHAIEFFSMSFSDSFLQVQYIDHKNLLCWKHNLIKQVAVQRYFVTTETIRTSHGDMAHLFLETWCSHKPMVVPQVMQFLVTWNGSRSWKLSLNNIRWYFFKYKNVITTKKNQSVSSTIPSAEGTMHENRGLHCHRRCFIFLASSSSFWTRFWIFLLGII